MARSRASPKEVEGKFRFNWLVELLESLDPTDKPNLISVDHACQLVRSWFLQHNAEIIRHGPSATAFLSCLLPHRLPHRNYGIRETRLATVIADCVKLPLPHKTNRITRRDRLKDWCNADVDFGQLVQSVISEAHCFNPGKDTVTLEEIETALDKIAANANFPEAETNNSETKYATEVLEPIVRRLQSHQIKWLVRMILKSYSPAQIPEQTILHCFHFLLPDILPVQNSIEVALETLSKKELRDIDPNPPLEQQAALRPRVVSHFVPRLGVMIQRQPYDKARSIKHCINMVAKRQASVEQKYDGEYCQIHVDISKGEKDHIQIFSKSGKDSTWDRRNLHDAIRKTLKLGEEDGFIRRNCILEGELLVWNRTEAKIQPFHVIRRHVLRAGRKIGTTVDPPKRIGDQLMIVYFDMMYHDDVSLLNQPFKDRISCLRTVVKPISGVGILAQSNILPFSDRNPEPALSDLFIDSIKERWEGLVVKVFNEPYFSWDRHSRVIKLKKDYIPGLGDTADLCIVGGYREPLVVAQLGLGKLQWTSFHLACIENKDAVREVGCNPVFRIVDVVDQNSMSKKIMLDLNSDGQFRQFKGEKSLNHSKLSTVYFDVSMARMDLRQPSELFKEPFVVEVLGAGFHKPSNAFYYTLRHPRLKLHTDRTFMETNSFEELQDMAIASLKDMDAADVKATVEKIHQYVRPERSGLEESELEDCDPEAFEQEISEEFSSNSCLVQDGSTDISSPPAVLDSGTRIRHAQRLKRPALSNLRSSGRHQLPISIFEKLKASGESSQILSAVKPLSYTASTTQEQDHDTTVDKVTIVPRAKLTSVHLTAVQPKASALSESLRKGKGKAAAIDPFNPPPAFRVFSGTSNKLASQIDPRLKPRARLPLNEIPNVSAQRDPKKRSASAKSLENPRADGSIVSNCSGPEKRPRWSGLYEGGREHAQYNFQDLPKRLKCTGTPWLDPRTRALQVLAHVDPDPELDTADFVLQLLTSHWFSAARQEPHEARRECGCSNCKLVLVKLVDRSKPSKVAETVDFIMKSVVNLWRQRVRNSPDKTSATPLTGIARDQKLVVFLDHQGAAQISGLKNSLRILGPNAKPQPVEVHAKAMVGIFNACFMGAMHFSSPTPFFSPESVSLVRKDGVGKVLDASTREISALEYMNRQLESAVFPKEHPGFNRPYAPPVAGETRLPEPITVQHIWSWDPDLLDLIESLGCHEQVFQAENDAYNSDMNVVIPGWFKRFYWNTNGEI